MRDRPYSLVVLVFFFIVLYFLSGSIFCIPLNLAEKSECDRWFLLLEVLFPKLLVLFSLLHAHYSLQKMALAQNP